MIYRTAMVALAWCALLPLAARADFPDAHPAYLRALGDLRAAYWLIQPQPGDLAGVHDDMALRQISGAIEDLRKASIDDGRTLDQRPADLTLPDRSERLQRACDLLKRVRADVSRREDDPFARGLQHRSLSHVYEAERQILGAIHDLQADHQ
jgi:hypothetical protein